MKPKLFFVVAKGNVAGNIEQNISTDFKYLFLSVILLAMIGLTVYLVHRCDYNNQDNGIQYWLTESTGRLHRKGCRYYGIGAGKYVANEFNARPCKLCMADKKGGK